MKIIVLKVDFQVFFINYGEQKTIFLNVIVKLKSRRENLQK